MALTYSQAADFTGGLATLLSTVASIKEGYDTERAYKQAAKNAKKSGEFEAAQYRQKAGQTRAEYQRKAIDERRQARLASSRATAVAAASGGGASDPGIMDILKGLAGQGEYNVLSQLYTGEDQARGYEDAAKGVMYNSQVAAQGYKSTGKAHVTNGWQVGMGTLLEGGATFLEKYGGDTSPSIGTYKQVPWHTQRVG